MKFYFEVSEAQSVRENVEARALSLFLGELFDPYGRHTIALAPGQADLIIHTDEISPTSRTSLLRPLSKEDINSFTWDAGDTPTGRMSGFYCSLPVELFDDRRHRTMSYLPVNNEFIEDFNLDDAASLVGFMGAVNCGLRRRMVDFCETLQSGTGWKIKVQGADRFPPLLPSPIKQEYADLMRSCKFILCPRGLGVGSVRFFETLKARRVPILISDRYVMPSKIDWDSCCVRVNEDRLQAIPDLLSHYAHRWRNMADAARLIWEKHFSPSGLLGYVAGCASEILASIGQIRRIDRMKYPAIIAAHKFNDKLRRSLADKISTI
jgi:hypothetical protein